MPIESKLYDAIRAKDILKSLILLDGLEHIDSPLDENALRQQLSYCMPVRVSQ